MISVITYNCQRLQSSILDIQALCSSYDLIFIRESWLFQFELPLLSKIHREFEGFGISAIDDSNNNNNNNNTLFQTIVHMNNKNK